MILVGAFSAERVSKVSSRALFPTGALSVPTDNAGGLWRAWIGCRRRREGPD